jgi:diacylglycerol O-acyltransferase
MSKERLSGIDILMLRVDNPASVNVVTGLMLLGAPVRRDQVEQTIRTRILPLRRFRQTLVTPRQPWRAPYWEEAPRIDLEYHLQEVTLPPPGDRAALQALVATLAARPLDPSYPLWQMHLVGPCDQSCAVICRVHHSMADGVALAHVVMSMTDGDPSDPTFANKLAASESPPSPYGRARGGSRRRSARRLARRSVKALAALPNGAELMESGMEVAADLSDVLLSPADSPTVLRGAPGIAKRVAWSDPIALDDIKTIGHRLGGTVNDILLAATTGALREYLLARGAPAGPASLNDADLRALVPISMRPPGTELEMGNRIGVVLLRLPVELADPAERLAQLRWEMDNQKGSYQAPILHAAMRACGRVGTRPLSLVVDYMGSKASVIVTNVRGPAERRSLAGAPLEAVMFWIPRYGGIALGVSILSYAGEVRIGVSSDRDMVPDPETVVACFHAEMDALLVEAEARESRPRMPSLSSRLDNALTALDEILGAQGAADGC